MVCKHCLRTADNPLYLIKGMSIDRCFHGGAKMDMREDNWYEGRMRKGDIGV